jgi:hypothetical protein
MGPNHALDFLATTKVRIQLWSSLNRCQRGVQQVVQRAWEPTSPAHHPLGRSEPEATNAPVEDEALDAILGMNQKHILPAESYWFFPSLLCPKKFSSYLPPSHLPPPPIFVSPSYLPPDFALTPSSKLGSRWSESGSKANALEARARVGVEPMGLKLEREWEREQSRAWGGPTNLDRQSSRAPKMGPRAGAWR